MRYYRILVKVFMGGLVSEWMSMEDKENKVFRVNSSCYNQLDFLKTLT